MTSKALPRSSRPALVRLVSPADVDTSVLVVAITSALRSRGFRVGTIEARAGIDGGSAVILTTGAGARMTLPATRDLETLRARAAAFDPGLDVVLVEGAGWPGGTPAIEVVAGDGTPSTASDVIETRRVSELGGPGDDLGLARVIEERVLGRRGEALELARASEAPIESARRLLERPSAQPRPPGGGRRGWRRWLGL